MPAKSKRQLRREAVAASSTSAVSRDGNKPSEFNPDYSYVLRDLRRIGILASSFFIILIILSFFLH
jgi:hypothetical protein